ncbi:proclotting enzyme-like [Copidosoma floridanum]|uniref:proclotting enzyme-like n=1 Tax=Copidosoma floridanum TaxID=29053 RepID=UPI0006C98803|nr:proclotting enzyme-like [Copidosoma floridanum]
MGRTAILGIASLLLLALGCGAAEVDFELQAAEDDDDAVVLEAPSRRRGRHLYIQNEYCVTLKGAVGKCLTLKECYPYFKIPNFPALEGWVLGIYDTCSYTEKDGRLSYGICCADPPPQPPNIDAPPGGPIIEAPDPHQELSVNSPNSNPHGGWPPPLPTHPPHHTVIPPLPTHPPGHGVAGFVPPSTSLIPPRPSKVPSTSHRPSVATTWPTKRPGGFPSATGPPWVAGSSVHPPSNSLNSACGSKNGAQDVYYAPPSEKEDDPRIVGGTTTQQGEWPWIAGLFNAGRHICGGSLIDDRHILTAAHCVAQMTSWDVARMTVRLGDYDIKTPNEVRHVEKRVKRVVRHRGFDMRTLYNDVALLTLNEPVEFTETIRPVCLPSGSSLYINKMSTVIGWGSLREGGPAPGKLQGVTIKIWPNSICKQKYGNAAPGGIVDSFLCAGEANRDSCSGDSGGPLMVNDGRWTQVGIVSWGIGCGKGQYPGVYTRVTHFLPWIYKNLK